MSTAGPSKAGSSSSTPAPASVAETLSHANASKPFKRSAFNKPLNRRNKALKQIVGAERDAALGITNRGRKRRVPGEEPLVIVRGKHRLAGAAAKAALRREAKAKEEAAAAAAEDGDEGSSAGDAADGDQTANGTAVASPAPSQGGAADADGTLEDISMAGHDTEAESTRDAAGSARRNIPQYWSTEAPPSLRPQKKYCDVTGLIAPYTDPRSRLRFHNAEVFEIVRSFGPGMDHAYLSVRGDSLSIK